MGSKNALNPAVSQARPAEASNLRSLPEGLPAGIAGPRTEWGCVKYFSIFIAQKRHTLGKAGLTGVTKP
jgi:hypothetical protein